MRRSLVTVNALAAVLAMGLTGCLKTRTDVREIEQKQVIQQEVTKLQRTNADVSTKFSDLEDDLRNLRGRLEVLEHKSGQSAQDADSVKRFAADQSADANKKIALLQEGLATLEKTVFQLNAEVNALQADRAAAAAQAAASQAQAASNAKKDPYEVAKEQFNSKDWKKAILSYQKYRDENPNGKKVADATYKIGVCFQELGMKDEAKTFYDEVISKHPNSDEARRAKVRLKSLKK
jgi:TolA-binding protein